MASDISFEQYVINGTAIACERLLGEFHPSTSGIQPFTFALVNQTQDWNDITQTVFQGRWLEDAIGVQLDIIGDIVGIERPLLDGDKIIYFQFDNPSNASGWDQNGPWFVTNAPDSGLVPANDSTYRQFIKGKIFKNQVTTASVPEILQFIEITFGIVSSVIPDPSEPMTIFIAVPSVTPESYVRLILSKETNKIVENNYFVPIANGVRIAGVPIIPDPPFGFDGGLNTKIKGWDVGKWSVTVPGV